LSLSFRQPVFTANTLRENLKEAEYQYTQTSARFTRGQMDIVYRVTEGFYSLYRAEQEHEIAAERLKNSEEAHRVARLKFETGRIPEGEVLIAEVEMSRNRAALLEVEGTLERERDEFRQLIGVEAGTDIRIVADMQFEEIAVDPAKAEEEALRSRPEVRESEMRVRQQEISVARAGREREIKGEISSYYDLTGVSTSESRNMGTLFQSSFDNFLDRPPNRGITLTFSYPVFDWGRAEESVKREEILLKERTLGTEDTKRTIVREVHDAVRKIGETRERLVIHEKNEEVARRSYDISRMRFENGDFTSQELAREQERLASARLDHLNALIAYRLAVADLSRKTMWDFRGNRSYLAADYFRERE
jgi:outer membrane protein TolC